MMMMINVITDGDRYITGFMMLMIVKDVEILVYMVHVPCISFTG